jgi:protocatechuate 3,4-dioxygenase beta subunit
MTTLVKYNSLDWAVQPPYLHPPYKSTVTRSPTRHLVPLAQSLSELTGQVYGQGMIYPLDND